MGNNMISKLSLSNNYKSSMAFTLAEVLITLLIIGVVASLTIPGIINSTNKAEYVTKLKKEYSILSQAFNLIKVDAGGSILNDSNFNSSTAGTAISVNAMNEFVSKMNVVKNCGSGMGCWYDSPLKLLGGEDYSDHLDSDWNTIHGKAILADGAMMMIHIYDTNCKSSFGSNGSPLDKSVCGYIEMDINGATGPNQFGRDFFEFWITQTGIYPVGIYDETYTCEIDSSESATSDGCAGKVLTEGAMNY